MTMTKIEFNLQGFDKSEIDAVSEAIRHPWVTSGGPMVESFENAIRRIIYCKTLRRPAEIIATLTGTTALRTILRHLPAKSRVMVPDISWYSTITAVIEEGHTPIILDVNPDTGLLCGPDGCPYDLYNFEFERSGANVTILVHLNGNICRISPQYRHTNLFVIEDAAQAFGSFYETPNGHLLFAGTEYDAGMLSFNGNKIVTTGQGGAIVAQYDNLAKDYRNFIDHHKKDETEMKIGDNYRMAGLNAAFGLAQLKKLPKYIEQRLRQFAIYCTELDLSFTRRFVCKPIIFQHPNNWCVQLWVPDAEKIHQGLTQAGVMARRVPKPFHLQTRFQRYILADQHFAGAEEYYSRVVLLPNGTNLTNDDIRTVCRVVRELDV